MLPRKLLPLRIHGLKHEITVLLILSFDGSFKTLILANDQEEGVPHLNYAYDEALAVASLFGAQPLLGAEATASALRTKAGDADIVHLIAHFELDMNHPGSTRILL
jgi:CHAT domain-containing protein